MRTPVRTHLGTWLYLMRVALLIVPMAAVVGSACALFLSLLDKVTHLRWEQPWLLYLLPIVGIAIGWIYHVFGGKSEAGNNLIMDEIHEPGGGVPLRMAPLVLIGTLATHLCGGSAGREGTAVQMGGSIASGFSKTLRPLLRIDTRTLLMAGIAAGFGGVFGTPLAGAIFAIEVLAIGRMSYAAVIPCLLASIVSDYVCTAWGVGHVTYHVASLIDAETQHHMTQGWLMVKVIIAAVAFGLVSIIFAQSTHGFQRLFRAIIPLPYLRPFVGGLIIIALVFLLGTRDYLGIGVTTPDDLGVSITSAFRADGADASSWFWKLLFTAITLGAGFKGGEVTPLFFIGATLGNTLAWLFNAPVDLFAALGFVAVFAGATNTPLACTIMAVELFGPSHVVYFAVACFIAYLFSGHNSIYTSQRIGTPKHGDAAQLEGTKINPH